MALANFSPPKCLLLSADGFARVPRDLADAHETEYALTAYLLL